MKRPTTLLLIAACAFGCSDSKKKMEERQAALEKARAEAKAEADKKTDAAAPAKVESARLEPFWDDPSYVKVVADGQCPDGIWALFNDVPGQDKEEKKANAAQKGDLAKKLRGSTFVVHLKPPDGVKLGSYDAPKGEFPLEVLGATECSDSFGHLTIAWAEAKAITPGASAAKAGSEVTQNIWTADPMIYKYPVRSQNDAKEFTNKHRFDLDARIVFKLGKTQVDKKMFKTSKQTSGAISIGGGNEDWGAGRMVKAEVLGVRVATDHEKTALVEKKGK